MRISRVFILFLGINLALNAQVSKYTQTLKSSTLPKQWDEALPLGNGYMGVLIWQKIDRSRKLLDKAHP